VKSILTYHLPAWCKLGFDPNKPAILFRIHKDFIQNELRKIKPSSPIIQDFQSRLPHIGEFKLAFENEFGFDGVFRRKEKLGPKNDSLFYEYTITIPNLRNTETCYLCNGIRMVGGTHCRSCGGKGLVSRLNWNNAHQVVATLASVSADFSCPEEANYTGDESQLLTFASVYAEGSCGSSINALFSKRLCEWMRERGEGKIPEVEDAMALAWARMNNGSIEESDRRRIEAVIDTPEGWLNISCPGQGCGLYPSQGFKDYNGDVIGAEFKPHNVDTPMQQLTLLAGLAALYQLAHKEIYGK
jgi:hypothetical protein